MFGFWIIIIRCIRGGSVYLKCWVVLFICLYSRVVYIEVIEEMIFFLFINVMRWFIVMCGVVLEFRLDRGINFVGVVLELNMNIVNVEDSRMRVFLEDKCIVWKFNFLYVLYFGGSWERMIGIVCCIFDVMFMDIKYGKLIYEVLMIFMVEVMVIMNLRLLVFVFGDVEVLFILLL